MDTGKLGKVTRGAHLVDGNSYHLRKAPASLQTQPGTWIGALPGPLKWRAGTAAILELARGTWISAAAGDRLFTHWSTGSHVHGPGHPIAHRRRGGCITTRDGPHRARYHQCAAGITRRSSRTFRSHAGSGDHGRCLELCGTEGGCGSTGRATNSTRSAQRAGQVVQASSDLDLDHVQTFGVRPLAQTGPTATC